MYVCDVKRVFGILELGEYLSIGVWNFLGGYMCLLFNRNWFCIYIWFVIVIWCIGLSFVLWLRVVMIRSFNNLRVKWDIYDVGVIRFWWFEGCCNVWIVLWLWMVYMWCSLVKLIVWFMLILVCYEFYFLLIWFWYL